MDSRKAYEMMREEYVEKEALELCNQIERQLERIATYDDGGMLNDIISNSEKQVQDKGQISAFQAELEKIKEQVLNVL